jgi:2-desacetyl-2-hydroxyethyl bacteriochlorophyllide A dehydrogenase
MKAMVYEGPRDVRYESVDDPELIDDRDIIVKMEACSICGSDLHIYHGEGFSGSERYSIGHEAVGEVVEVGRGVRSKKPGDKVMLPGAVGCGDCELCLKGYTRHCMNGRQFVYGLGAGLDGCQAEAIRVPVGDFNAIDIPEGVTIEQALMLTDSMSTAWFGCRLAEVGPGDVTAIIGLGPIGLMAVESAFVMGASRVFAIDPLPDRRAIATGLGAIALDPAEAIEEVREATGGRMADQTVEIVGKEETIKLALKLAKRMGTVSSIGGGRMRHIAFPQAAFYRQGLTFRSGSCSTPLYYPQLFPLVQQGRLRPEKFITHQMSLSEGAEAYAMFDQRRDGILKTIMRP